MQCGWCYSNARDGEPGEKGASAGSPGGGGASTVGGSTRAELAKVGGSLPGRERKRSFLRVGTV